MAEARVFQYRPRCSDSNCGQPAVYKVAATWSDGTSFELKNYGLSCEAHRQSRLDRARRNRDRLRLADGETVGPVELFALKAGQRDTQLTPIESAQAAST